MALSLKDPETDRLAREMASITGESLTEAVKRSLQERLERQHFLTGGKKMRRARLDEIIARLDQLPVIDGRSADEILGYTEEGLFG